MLRHGWCLQSGVEKKNWFSQVARGNHILNIEVIALLAGEEISMKVPGATLSIFYSNTDYTDSKACFRTCCIPLLHETWSVIWFKRRRFEHQSWKKRRWRCGVDSWRTIARLRLREQGPLACWRFASKYLSWLRTYAVGSGWMLRDENS